MDNLPEGVRVALELYVTDGNINVVKTIRSNGSVDLKDYKIHDVLRNELQKLCAEMESIDPENTDVGPFRPMTQEEIREYNEENTNGDIEETDY